MAYNKGRVNYDPRFIKARYNSVCAETGKMIKAGDNCLYFPRAKKAYHVDSKTADDWRSQSFADNAGLLDAGW